MSTWPPVVPAKLESEIRIEVVDSDTIKIIHKESGTVLRTMTKTEYDSAANPVVKTYQG